MKRDFPAAGEQLTSGVVSESSGTSGGVGNDSSGIKGNWEIIRARESEVFSRVLSDSRLLRMIVGDGGWGMG